MGNPARAEKEKSYQKSAWQHWGVALPQMDLAIREILKNVPAADRLALSRRLWREPVWDLKIVAGRLLTAPSVPPTEPLWRFVTARMADLDGWAVADNLAPVASRCLLHDPRRLDVAEGWVQSPHLWTRRAALVFTLPPHAKAAIPSGCWVGPEVLPAIASGSSRKRSAGGCASSPSATRPASAASSPSTALR
jgi:DNA alkylation repair enzyme